MTISTAVREKVIQMAQQNKGRNRIAHELGIGQGSVSNILKELRQREGTNVLEQNRKKEQPEPTRVTAFPEETLAEIKFKKNKDIEINNHKITNTHQNDWEKNGQSVDFRGQGPLDWFMDGRSKTKMEIEPSVHINNTGVIVNEISKSAEEEKNIDLNMDWDSNGGKNVKVSSPTFKTQELVPKSKPKPNLSADVAERERLEREHFERERIAWEYYGRAQDRILAQIRKEKDQRRHELLLIARREVKLTEMKNRARTDAT